MTRMMKSGGVLASVFSLSFIFNFVWESFHAVYLYQEHDINSASYIPMMLYVSVMDALLIGVMYLAVALLWRNLLWMQDHNNIQIIIFLLIGILIAGFIEYRAVFVTGKWSYRGHMPTILGLGVSPLAQLSTTGGLALWITRRLLFERGFFLEK